MMELRERIARAICGNWIVGDDRPWQQWVEEADAVIEVLAKQEPVAWLRAPDKNNRRKLSFERPTGSSPTKALWSPLYPAPVAQAAVPEDIHRDAMRYRAVIESSDDTDYLLRSIAAALKPEE